MFSPDAATEAELKGKFAAELYIRKYEFLYNTVLNDENLDAILEKLLKSKDVR